LHYEFLVTNFAEVLLSLDPGFRRDERNYFVALPQNKKRAAHQAALFF